MKNAGRLAFLLLLLPLTGHAAPAKRGDVAFPLEVWGIVCRWHVGSAARSAREGWLLRETKDRNWPKIAAGRNLPNGPAGLWLRTSFVIRPKEWREPTLFLDGLPDGARVFLNMLPLDLGGSATIPLGAELRAGTNLLVVVTPAPAGAPYSAPRGAVSGQSRRTGKRKPVSVFRTWKWKAETVEGGIPEAWIRSPDASVWRATVNRPPAAGDAGIPDVPACWKAALEFPMMWRGRPVAVYFHDIPGEPDVWVNGVRIAEALKTPARLDLAGSLRFNGRDTLCLVYRRMPAGGTGGGRGLVALRWDAAQPVPALPSGTPWRLEAPDGPGLAGAGAALAYASEILALSSSPYELRWTAGGPTADSATRAADSGAQVVVAGWPATGFRTADLAAAKSVVAGRLDELAAAKTPTWVITHPSVGRSRLGVINERLMFHNRALRKLGGRDVRFIPVFEVTRSALKRAKRGPVQPEFATDAGEWTPAGSYVAALALLDALSLP